VSSYQSCHIETFRYLSARTPTPYLNEHRLSHSRVSMKKSCLYEGVMSLGRSHVSTNESRHIETAFLQGRRPHILVSAD